MQPTNVVLEALADLLAEDTATLAPAALANHVHLIQEAFTPGVDTDFTTLLAADFTGSTAKNVGVGAQQVFIDAETSERVIQLLEPAGGWHWEATDGVNLPQTIYGVVLTDNANAVTLGSALLPEPIVLSGAGQGFNLNQLQFRFSTTPLS